MIGANDLCVLWSAAGVKTDIYFDYNHYQHHESGYDVKYEASYIHLPAWQAEPYNQEADGQEGDPLFLNRNGRDYKLQSGSPCIDQGTDGVTAGFTDDYLGTTRPTGAEWDIGAYEYIATLTATEIATGAPTLATPTIGQIHALTATEIATGAPALGTPAPAIYINRLTAIEIATGAPILATPAIGQTHALTATEIATASPTLAVPTIGQIHALGSTEIATGAPIIDTSTIRLSDVLLADDLYAGQPTLDTATLAQIHTLVASGIITGPPELGTPNLRIAYQDLILVTGEFTQLVTVSGAFTQTVTVSGKLLEED